MPARLVSRLIVDPLNDNAMSIARPVGALDKHLRDLVARSVRASRQSVDVYGTGSQIYRSGGRP